MSETRVHLSKAEPAAYDALDQFARTVGQICRDNGIDDRLKEIVMIHCSQLNGCAYCARVHLDRAVKAGLDTDTIVQIPTWRESGVFSERERAALELAEVFTFIETFYNRRRLHSSLDYRTPAEVEDEYRSAA